MTASGRINPSFLPGPAAALLVIGVFCAFAPRFASAGNAANIAGQVAVLALLTAGQLVVMLVRGFDISVGAVAALSSTVCALMFNRFGTAGLLAGPAAGLLVGWLNATLVARLGVQPIIATLGALLIAKATARLISDDGQAVPFDGVTGLGRLAFDTWLGLPQLAWLALAGCALLAAWLAWSAPGRRIFLAGSQPAAARLLGMDVGRSLRNAYAVCGLMAGCAGVVLALRSGTGLPSDGSGLELQSIAAALIGGTALAGGSGSVAAALCGALLIQVLLTGLNLTGLSPFVAQVLLGALILASGYLDSLGRRLGGRAAH